MVSRLFKKPLIILEFANNHMGDATLFKAMVDDYALVMQAYPQLNFAIKLQYRDLDTFIHPNFKGTDHAGVSRFESTRVSIVEWSPLIDYALSRGFEVGCTPFDEVSIENILEDNRFSFLKIGSCSFNDWPFLEAVRERVSGKGLPTNVIASTGGMELQVVDRVVSFLGKVPQLSLSLMHCVAEYPSKVENQNIGWIGTLADRYGLRTGFSTHETGAELSTGAFAYCSGAQIFEKHVVSSTAETVNAYSANPAQIRQWLDGLVKAMTYVGSGEARIARFPDENRYLNNFRRGVFARSDLADGPVAAQDVYMAYPRVDGQLTANDWSGYAQFRLTGDLPANAPLIEKSISIENDRATVDGIRSFVASLLNQAGVVVASGTRIEISHHYGIERFDEFGAAMLTLVNFEYCKKLILMKKGQRHPEQFHKQKRETFIILYGEVELIIDGEASILRSGDVVTINPGQVHAFKGLSDVIVEEISTTHNVDDSFYVDETISQNKNRKSFVSLFGMSQCQ